MIGGGDTPEENTFKYDFTGGSGNFIAGYYAKKEGEFIDAFCYAFPDNPEQFALFNSEGTLFSTGFNRNDSIEQQMLDRLMAAIDQQVENVYLVPCPVSIGETLVGFDDYLQV